MGPCLDCEVCVNSAVKQDCGQVQYEIAPRGLCWQRSAGTVITSSREEATGNSTGRETKPWSRLRAGEHGHGSRLSVGATRARLPARTSAQAPLTASTHLAHVLCHHHAAGRGVGVPWVHDGTWQRARQHVLQPRLHLQTSAMMNFCLPEHRQEF